MFFLRSAASKPKSRVLEVNNFLSLIRLTQSCQLDKGKGLYCRPRP